jgi:hypothetical protein
VPATATSRAWGAWTAKATRFLPIFGAEAPLFLPRVRAIKHLLNKEHTNSLDRKLQSLLMQGGNAVHPGRNNRLPGKEKKG